MNPYWSWLLTGVGVFGLWLAGRRDRRGWMVGVGAQVLWIAYATATHQWGFYFSALAYGWVYVRNARAWKVAKPATEERVTAMKGIQDTEILYANYANWHETVSGKGCPFCAEKRVTDHGPVCRYCGADCSEGRLWDGGDLYACSACADARAAHHVRRRAAGLPLHPWSPTCCGGSDLATDWNATDKWG
jgi:hypothetical protein